MNDNQKLSSHREEYSKRKDNIEKEPRFNINGIRKKISQIEIVELTDAIGELENLLSTYHSLVTVKNRINNMLSKNYGPIKVDTKNNVMRTFKNLEELKKAQNFSYPKQHHTLQYTYNYYEKSIASTSNFDSIIRGEFGLASSFGKRFDCITLSGGGAKGSFEAGVLYHLEKSGILSEIDLVTGASVGSLNALAVSFWKEQAGTEIGKLWFFLKSVDDMYRPTNHFNDLVDLLEELGVTIEDDMDFSMEENPAMEFLMDNKWILNIPLIGDVVSRLFANGVEDKLNTFTEFLEKLLDMEGLYSLEPIKGIISHRLPDNDELLPLRIVLVNPVDGCPYYVNEDAEMYKMSNTYPREILRKSKIIAATKKEALLSAALGSSTIPILFEPMYFIVSTRADVRSLEELQEAFANGEININSGIELPLMWDGGLRDNLPLHASIDAGAKKILAVSNSVRKIKEAPLYTPYDNKGLIYNLTRTLDIILDESFESDRLHVNEKDITCTFIEPELAIQDLVEVDPGLIRINFEYGFMRSYNSLSKLPNTVQELLDNGNSLVFFLWAIGAVFSTEEIAALRKEIWKLERKGCYWSSDSERLIWDQQVLRRIRNKKHKLRKVYKTRLDAWGTIACFPDPLPDYSNISDSWLEWERHTGKLGDRLQLSPKPFERQVIGNNTTNFYEDIDDIPDQPRELSL